MTTPTFFLALAVTATAIFLIQFIVSIFFGDLDTDLDTTPDADFGSMISFKGLTHFCIGMGWYIYLSGGNDALSYGIGILTGLVFVFILWFLYKKAYQLQKENRPEKNEALLGRECTIYAHTGNRFVVQIAINGALREREVRSLSGKNYQTGEKATVCKVENSLLYIE